MMLHVYATDWCPHCQKAVAFLRSENIPFQYIDMDTASPELIRKIDEVNGGEWVVPTLEYQGKWIPGKVFNEKEMRCDLQSLGILKD